MAPILRVREERASAIKVKLRPVEVRRLPELDAAVTLAKTQVEALTVVDDGLFVANARRIAEVTRRMRLPGMGFREPADLPIQQATRFELIINRTTAKMLGLTTRRRSCFEPIS